MKNIKYLFVVLALSHCASKTPTDAPVGGDSANYPSGTAMRHLAWAEGDLQNNYEPNRKVAQEKLTILEREINESSGVDSQLEYLSVLSASGKATEAETKIKAFLAKNPTEKRGVFLLAVHYLKTKKRELANHFFTQLEADKSFPWKSLLYNNLGMMALQDKNRRAALDYFEKATKAEPPTAAPLVNLGALYLQSRSYKEAHTLFERAVAIDDQMEDAWLGYGASLEGLGKFEEAHNVYARYMEKNPNALSVVYNDSIVLGNRLKNRTAAAELMLRYIQRGGKETAKAHEIIQSWR